MSVCDFQHYFQQALDKIRLLESQEDLEKWHQEVLGKQGWISSAMKALVQMSLDEKRIKGQEISLLRDRLQKAFQEKKEDLEKKIWEKKLKATEFQGDLPFETVSSKMHPLMVVTSDIVQIFQRMGFSRAFGPDVEYEWYNFDALNIGPQHPSRASHDTFYVNFSSNDEALHPCLLRTHTSPVQIRALLEKKPPVRMISYGRVYRADQDRTHSPMFHQLEGLVVEKHLNLGHLKGTLSTFLKEFFGSAVKVRFRPSFFPFTTCSMEVDIQDDQGRWLEVMGCGMVHKNVFQACQGRKNFYHEGEDLTGFAFGMGLDRMTMLRYGIQDLRSLFINDQRWLSVYGQGCTYPGF